MLQQPDYSQDILIPVPHPGVELFLGVFFASTLLLLVTLLIILSGLQRPGPVPVFLQRPTGGEV